MFERWMRCSAHTYELDPATATYALTGIFRDRLKTTVPFADRIGRSDQLNTEGPPGTCPDGPSAMIGS
ncbi:hypothetical protein [Lentzea sp. E54]|uniref:hypothetical protein n=1 Tax=Lentzea xerophila TaxID=3435883 RepID=UPI003DA20154